MRDWPFYGEITVNTISQINQMWYDNTVLKLTNYALTEEWAAKMCKEGKAGDWTLNMKENKRFYPIAFMKHKTIHGKIEIEDEELPNGIFITAPEILGSKEPVLLSYRQRGTQKKSASTLTSTS